jgi:hypothetical protein
MNYSKWIVSAFILIGANILMSCEDPTDTNTEEIIKAENKLAEAEDALVAARIDSVTDFSNFKIEMERVLAANEATIEILKTNITHQKNELKAKYNQQIESLEAENIKLKAKLRAFALGTNEPWDFFKASFIRETDSLGISILTIAEKAKKEQ